MVKIKPGEMFLIFMANTICFLLFGCFLAIGEPIYSILTGVATIELTFVSINIISRA